MMRVALLALFAVGAQASFDAAADHKMVKAAVKHHDVVKHDGMLHASAARKMLKADPMPLPEQGYHGKGVAHADMETVTSDWSEEYGPKSKGAIAQGYGVPPVAPASPGAPHKSGASRAAGVMTALAAVALSQAF
mmetsp:Transcript_48440/g.142975  ORF Transcript_48440/g.142975 Transcript_48440/m.142975 type:complete len:135 (-) Transcript_48440:58-462(-)